MYKPRTPADYRGLNFNIVKYIVDPYTPSRYTQTYVTGTEASVAVKQLHTRIRAWLEGNANNQTYDWEIAFNSAMTLLDPGEVFVQPVPLVSIRSVKIGIDNDDFWARSRRGEIVVSDYERASVRVRQTPGLITSKPVQYERTINFSLAVEHGLLEMANDPNGSSTLHIPGTEYFLNVRMHDAFVIYKGDQYSRWEWKFDPLLDADTVISACRNEIPDFTSMITKTLAKANRSSVDVLTAAAEMPKSVASLLSGFKQVATMLRDAKKGQFNLSKAHADRVRKTNLRHKQRMSRLLAEVSNSRTSATRRKVLIAAMERERYKNRTLLAKLSDELASSLANLWLNYRYNIMPNVYLAQDVFDAVTKFNNEFVTARGSSPGPTSIDIGGGVRIDVESTLRCMIKRSFSATAISKGQSVISNDIFVAAWELVPLSFVYDWFLNIGDLLSAQMYSNKWAQEGATKSTHLDFDVEISFPDNIEWTVEPTTSVDGKYYRRQVINPIDECGLVWQPSVGLERQVDALALIWRPVRSLLHKGKNR